MLAAVAVLAFSIATGTPAVAQSPPPHDPDRFEETLDYGELERTERIRIPGGTATVNAGGGTESVTERRLVVERVAVPVAAGLVLLLLGLHLRRFLSTNEGPPSPSRERGRRG